ncbi:uncharacterized protein LOC123317389 isoform X2 [Coccinella septempunctata]|uniref:uncharacterized protein LOC123317389 isoform X2 n=1 Tax=Coccinella septempunctata TaxID=41139 RepID=UPI001D08E273|nr:uncharacterized protein LOC123317389 isoform X2 [Coccinella septempunctata]
MNVPLKLNLEVMTLAVQERLGIYEEYNVGHPQYVRHIHSPVALNQDRPTITSVARGCQAIQYGSTCEDIFNDLRGRGSFHHGHHKCSTCSADFCNSSESINLSSQIFFISIFLAGSYNYLACR